MVGRHGREDRFAIVTLDRRTFLLGAGAVLLGACSSSTPAPDVAVGPPVDLQALFSSNRSIAAGREERLPLGLLRDGLAAGGVDEITVDVRDDDGTVIDTVTVGAMGTDGVRTYFPVRTTLPAPGIYELATVIEGSEIVQFVQAFDPAEVMGFGAGEALPVVASPTEADPLGIERLCTRFQGCGFHGTNLADVVGTGQKIALLVATPAFCQTFWCGPILDDLIEAAPRHPDVLPIHVEVYANTDTVENNIADPNIELAPTVVALGLDFEPSLYLVDGDGTIIRRLDHTIDPVELEAALAELSAV